MTIDEFVDKNEVFRNILSLPRVAELIDVAREIERGAWEIRLQESALLETVEHYRREAAHPHNWAIVVYKGLIAQVEREKAELDATIERTVDLRTLALRQRLAEASAEIQRLRKAKK